MRVSSFGSRAPFFLVVRRWCRRRRGEIVSAEDLGGADVHARTSGVVDHYARNDHHALSICRRIVGGLNRGKPAGLVRRPVEAPKYDPAELLGVVPSDLRAPYDAREVIARIVDGSVLDEFKKLYGTTLVCGFAHLYGYPVGIIAKRQRDFVFGIFAEGGALHRVVQSAGHSVDLLAEYHWVHGGAEVRGGWYRKGWGEVGYGGLYNGRAENYFDHWRQLWRWQLWDVRGRAYDPRFFPVYVAECAHFGDGRRTTGMAGVLATVLYSGSAGDWTKRAGRGFQGTDTRTV